MLDHPKKLGTKIYIKNKLSFHLNKLYFWLVWELTNWNWQGTNFWWRWRKSDLFLLSFCPLIRFMFILWFPFIYWSIHFQRFHLYLYYNFFFKCARLNLELMGGGGMVVLNLKYGHWILNNVICFIFNNIIFSPSVYQILYADSLKFIQGSRFFFSNPDECRSWKPFAHTSHTSLTLVRLALSRTRLLTRAAKGFMCRSHSKSGDSIGENDNENKDYIPLVGSRSARVNALPTCMRVIFFGQRLIWKDGRFFGLKKQTCHKVSSQPEQTGTSSCKMFWIRQMAKMWCMHSFFSVCLHIVCLIPMKTSDPAAL